MDVRWETQEARRLREDPATHEQPSPESRAMHNVIVLVVPDVIIFDLAPAEIFGRAVERTNATTLPYVPSTSVIGVPVGHRAWVFHGNSGALKCPRSAKPFAWLG
jgi:hypothetical protein